jgi:hypothetical protein
MASLQKLSAFLEANQKRAWEWSVVDCCMTPADWAVELGSEDPVPDLRGTYHTEEECRALVLRAGGIMHLVSRLEQVGWHRASSPSDGSIAVIGSPTIINRQWAAICHEGRWKVRMDIGFVPFMARPLAMWAL